jgi:hypothetical protein
LRDRCPHCGDGIAAFAQRDLIAQHVCCRCGDDLRIAPRIKLLAATRRKAKVIDDLCRFEAARGFAASSSLTRRLIHLPSAISSVVPHTLTQLSVAARIGCIDRIDSGLTGFAMTTSLRSRSGVTGSSEPGHCRNSRTPVRIIVAQARDPARGCPGNPSSRF